jgi:hypothetical protein
MNIARLLREALPHRHLISISKQDGHWVQDGTDTLPEELWRLVDGALLSTPAGRACRAGVIFVQVGEVQYVTTEKLPTDASEHEVMGWISESS